MHINKYKYILSTYELGFWVFTVLAEHKLFDEQIEDFLKFVRIVGSVDDVAIVLLVDLCLGSQLTSEELGGVRSGTSEGLCSR